MENKQNTKDSQMTILKIGFHDRDGHLICPYPEDVPNWEKLTPFERQAPWFIPCPERQMILPGVRELLDQFDLNFIVSNQKLKLIADSPECNYEAILKTVGAQAEWLMENLPIDAFVFCPDEGAKAIFIPRNGEPLALHEKFPYLCGTFRKPCQGMIEAIKLIMPLSEDNCNFSCDFYGFGDRESDKIAFESAGIKFEWSDIARGYPDSSLRHN